MNDNTGLPENDQHSPAAQQAVDSSPAPAVGNAQASSVITDAPPVPNHAPVLVSNSSRNRTGLLIGAGFAAGVLATVLVGAIGAAIASVSESKVLAEAIDACGGTGKAGLSLGDEGKSLSLDTEGTDDFTGASIGDLTCVLDALKTPDSVQAQMDSTSSMQGRQTAEWDGLKASWTYHPDSGFKLIVELAKK